MSRPRRAERQQSLDRSAVAFRRAGSTNLNSAIYLRLQTLAGRRMTRDGVVVISADRFLVEPRAQPSGCAGTPHYLDTGSRDTTAAGVRQSRAEAPRNAVCN